MAKLLNVNNIRFRTFSLNERGYTSFQLHVILKCLFLNALILLLNLTSAFDALICTYSAASCSILRFLDVSSALPDIRTIGMITVYLKFLTGQNIQQM